jgi:hypothetical protein
MVLLIVLAVVAVLLIVLGFLAPRLSRRPQQKADDELDRAQGKAKRAPGPLSKVLEKPVEISHKTVDKSTDLGRNERGKTG